MTLPCPCTAQHPRQRVVLTGGPGAGKTAVLELVQQAGCQHVVVLPEAASLLFRGGFPRGPMPGERAAVQRAIFHVQRELEAHADVGDNAAMQLCDRGTIDGAAYWPGPDTLWSQVGTKRDDELRRYNAVIHLRTPDADAYNHDNPMRTESLIEAQRIDAAIAVAWDGHPRCFIVDSSPSFLDKAQQALAILETLMPKCCPRLLRRA